MWSFDLYYLYCTDGEIYKFPYLHNALRFAATAGISGYVECPDGTRVDVAELPSSDDKISVHRVKVA